MHHIRTLANELASVCWIFFLFRICALTILEYIHPHFIWLMRRYSYGNFYGTWIQRYPPCTILPCSSWCSQLISRVDQTNYLLITETIRTKELKWKYKCLRLFLNEIKFFALFQPLITVRNCSYVSNSTLLAILNNISIIEQMCYRDVYDCSYHNENYDIDYKMYTLRDVLFTASVVVPVASIRVLRMVHTIYTTVWCGKMIRQWIFGCGLGFEYP